MVLDWANAIALLFVSTQSEWGLPGLSLLLPIGISFFTFQAISYTVSTVAKAKKPIRSYTLLPMWRYSCN
jgi:D-alanyl-lipoteichoic acid acyltransferase DltB (MBOAT superfamily)